MEFTLLCNLGGPRNAGISLRLRLLHVWPSKSPGDNRIYNYYTFWTDETGMLIQGVSPTSMAAGIRRNLSVGMIYVIKSFALSNPPNQYRSCSFDLALGLSPSISFLPCALPAESFPVDAYEFVVFSQLSIRADVVGRLHSISGISHKITNNGPAVKQTVIIEDERFAEKHETVASLPVEFATAADATADADRRTKTLGQLMALSRTNSSLEEKYRFGGVIVDVESSTPCYKLLLTLRDDSCEARFILMGGCALALVNVSAAHLAQRFPHRPGQLPPQLHQLRGQYVKFDCRLPFSGPTGFSSGEFCVTQVVPLDDPTVVGDLLEFSLPQSSASPSLGAASSVGGPSGSSRAAKGKEKVSDSIPIEAPAVPFNIADQQDVIERFPSPAPKILRDPIPVNVGGEDIDDESRILGYSQLSVMGVQRSAKNDESVSSQDVGRDSSMPASKILKPSPESSPGKPLGSATALPSASLLVSPLARIKVEKLDAADVAQVSHGAPSQAGVNMERDSSVDSQKNSSTKRAFFKK
ncbi:unnamed protein product [Linum tenue]|uniref:Uncharacterized protein n=1 Tax=Linum tenue TaxID=586396 RepID=A0AAV0NL29_9ROSI|nr:unnamed protein product [Linum tenue]